MTSIHRGMTFGFCARPGYYDSTPARQEVDRMKSLNVEWVCLVVTIMQESANSPRMFLDFEQTPADYEVIDIIDYVHGQGMKVHLRPMIECHDGHGRTEVQFPADGERIPGRRSDCYARWFASMRARTRHYAKLAQRTRCEMYGIESEVDRFIHMTKPWREVVEVARANYGGPVTSCHTWMNNLVDVLKAEDHWLRDLDMLGTSMYGRSAMAHGASLESRVAFLKEHELPQYRELARGLGKPVMFGECGCTSSFGGSTQPWGWSGAGGYEPSEQADHLEAVMRVFWDEPWWAGLYWWKWDEQNDRAQFKTDPRGDKGFTIWGKPAADVVKNWYGRTNRRLSRVYGVGENADDAS